VVGDTRRGLPFRSQVREHRPSRAESVVVGLEIDARIPHVREDERVRGSGRDPLGAGQRFGSQHPVDFRGWGIPADHLVKQSDGSPNQLSGEAAGAEFDDEEVAIACD